MNKVKVLVVADRIGWACDRLSRPLSEIYDNVDMSYFYTRESRYLNTGYGKKVGNVAFNEELAKGYDVIHFHCASAAAIHIRDSGFKGIRKIVTKHTERDDNIRWHLFDDIICPTKFIYEQMKSKGLKVRLHHVPYGIDLKKYRCLWEKPSENTIGYVGRIIEHKRFDHILNAAVDANLRLISCGYVENPYLMKRPRIKNKISQGKDYDFVTFLPEEDIVNFYSRMGLFICGSEPNIEAGPLPVMEAMACGIPVLSTNIGWLKDWGENEKTFWRLEHGSLERWSKIFRDVYNRQDIRNRLRDNGLKLIKNFSIEIYAEKLMKIYEE